MDGSGIITKTGTTAWNAGGASVETITGDGSVKWTISSSLPENKYIMVGLSTNNIDENYTTIQYAWYARDLECRIYESGANIGTYGGFSEGTNFEIKRTGTTLEYLKDGVVQRTVLGVSTLPFLVDFSMYESGTKIEHLEIITGVTEEVYYVADVVSQSDYYPFGMLMPNTSDEPEEADYRYGFNGMEKDDEVKGDNNSYTTHFRQLDPRIGRWLSIDPKATPWESPYVSMSNSPIQYNDGLGDKIVYGVGKKTFEERRRIRTQVKTRLAIDSEFREQHESYQGFKNRKKTLVYDDNRANEFKRGCDQCNIEMDEIEAASIDQAKFRNGRSATDNVDFVSWNIALVPRERRIKFYGNFTVLAPDWDPSILLPAGVASPTVPINSSLNQIINLALWVAVNTDKI